MNKWNTSDGENSSEEYLQNITLFIEEHLGMYEKWYQVVSSNLVFAQIQRDSFSILSLVKTIDQLLLSGASHVNYETLIPLTLIYSVFLVIGILGNLATCVVILNNEYLR